MRRKTLILISIAVLYRISLVVIFSHSVNDIVPEKTITSYFGTKANDYGYYIPPAEKLFTEGNYSYRDNIPFAGRMPGYAFLYLLFRFFSSPETAILLVIFFQTIIGAIATVLLAKSSEIIFPHRHSFLITYIIGFLYPASIFFDYQTLTEGLTISLISIAIYFTISFFKKQSLYTIFIAGLLLVWAFFLRPFIGILFPIWGVVILYRTKGVCSQKLKYGIVWAIPFLVITGSWTLRNYYQFQQFIPLETSITTSYGKIYSKGWIEIRSLIAGWGGEAAYFEPNSEAEWFRKDTSNSNPPLTMSFYQNNPISKDELIDLKKDYQTFLTTPGYDSILDTRIVLNASLLNQKLKENQTFFTKVKIQLSRVQKVTIRFGSAYMPNLFNNKVDFLFRAFFSLSYFACLLFAVIGLIINTKKYGLLALPVIVQLIALLYVSSILEFRYFLTMMPFITLLATIGFTVTIDFIKKKSTISHSIRS